MSTQMIPLGYFQAPEGDIICVMSASRNNHSIGKIVRFNPKAKIFFWIYSDTLDVQKTLFLYKEYYRKISRKAAQGFIEAFKEMFGDLCDNLS